MKKVCQACKVEKSTDLFYRKKDTRDGRTSKCKECINLDRKNERHLKNKDKPPREPKSPEYHREYQRNYREKNKDILKVKAKERLARRKEHRRKYMRDYMARRRKEDPIFCLDRRIRALITKSFRSNGYTKNHKAAVILGCTFEEFVSHIESLFLEGMSWDNRDRWHLDHITPASWATNEEEVIRLNHYTNFQPLWAEDNIRKLNRYSG